MISLRVHEMSVVYIRVVGVFPITSTYFISERGIATFSKTTVQRPRIIRKGIYIAIRSRPRVIVRVGHFWRFKVRLERRGGKSSWLLVQLS